jgi:hypothetical protein
MSYKATISIQVIWHPSFTKGAEYGRHIYETFMRPLDQPLKRGPGIQVFFRNAPIIPARMEQEKGYRIYVLMVEPFLINSNEWIPYLEKLNDHVVSSMGKHLIIPVRASDNNLSNPGAIDKSIQQILLHEATENIRVDYLLIRIIHVIYRFLHDTGPAESATAIEPPRIQLFLSHAKKDGKNITRQLNTYIRNTFGLDTFFDALNIETGYPFDRQLEKHAGNSALLVVQTDTYSSRPWCRKEIIAAKTHGCPIVVFNKFDMGEERSFPYMSNVPVVYLDLDIKNESVPDSTMIRLVRIALTDFLRFKYQQHYLSYLNEIFNVRLPAKAIFPAPPELITLLPLHKEDNPWILYPDPLLGDEETQILMQLNSNFRFFTPPLLALLPFRRNESGAFKNITVGISITGSEAPYDRGCTDAHLQDVMVDISRYLLATHATLVYGGSLHQVNGVNFTTLLFDLVNMYNAENVEPAQKVINFSVFPYAQAIDAVKEAELKNVAEIRRVPLPEDVLVDTQAWETYIRSTDPEKRAVTARLLTLMRNELDKATHAHLFLGGKISDYDGAYPGILEEILIAIKNKKAVYLVGAYGGCAGLFCDYLSDHQIDNPLAQKFPDELGSFQQKGWAALNNGLSKEDNLQLATTRQVAEITQFILKGLSQKFPNE